MSRLISVFQALWGQLKKGEEMENRTFQTESIVGECVPGPLMIHGTRITKYKKFIPLIFKNKIIMNLHTPKTLEELKKVMQPVKKINVLLKQNLSEVDKLAMWVTQRVGTMGFFFIIFIWTAIWLGWNTLAPMAWRFDPYPAFVLWLFISNMVQIFLMPLIMVGQNLQSEQAERRAEADFAINIKAEEEIETILMHLENQNALILQVLNEMKPQGNKEPPQAQEPNPGA